MDRDEKRKIITEKLAEIVGREHIATSREELLSYSYDGTGQEFLPEAVAFPGSTDEISRIMVLADQEKFPVVVRGAGSGMTGGSLPVKGGLVLAMSRFKRIIEIDQANQIAIVEPGVINGHLRDVLKPMGLFYPPDPASLNFCTLGGNIAECAGGPSAVKYGVTRDYVLGLEVVLADGRVIETGCRTAKGVVGYDLTRLFVGSEGTLGIITRIIMKLLPLPTAAITFLVCCRSMPQATGLVRLILEQLQPRTLEFMDKTAIALVKNRLPFALSAETAAILLIEVDGSPVSVKNQAAQLADFLDRQDVLSYQRADNRTEADLLWQARRAVSPAAFALRPDKISEDVVVPRSKIPELVTFTEELARKHNLPVFTFGHAGDGNIHVNIMLDKKNKDELEQAEEAKKALFREVIRLSGTLSGEHGIGNTKSRFLPLELGSETIKLMRQIKKLFDPHDILNPGKIFPEDQS